jgi:hypothetical protein
MKKTTIMLMVLLLAASVQPANAKAVYGNLSMPDDEIQGLYSADGTQMRRSLRITVDCSGGCSAGNIKLKGGQLPAKAIVTHGLLKIDRAFTSSTGTAHLAVMADVSDNTTQIYAGQISNSRWAVGIKTTYLNSDNESAIFETANPANLYLKVSNQAVTAGRATLFLDYWIGR